MAVQLRNSLGKLTGKTLPVTLAFQYPTIKLLSEYLLSLWPQPDGQPEGTEQSASSRVVAESVQEAGDRESIKAQQALKELGQLADHQVDALLNSLLAEPSLKDKTV
jgi:hypothetical protein